MFEKPNGETNPEEEKKETPAEEVVVNIPAEQEPEISIPEAKIDTSGKPLNPLKGIDDLSNEISKKLEKEKELKEVEEIINKKQEEDRTRSHEPVILSTGLDDPDMPEEEKRIQEAEERRIRRDLGESEKKKGILDSFKARFKRNKKEDKPEIPPTVKEIPTPIIVPAPTTTIEVSNPAETMDENDPLFWEKNKVRLAAEEAENEEAKKEIEAEIENLSPEEKEKVGIALNNIGFKVQEGVNSRMAEVLEKVSHLGKDKNGLIARYFGAAHDSYLRDAEAARQNIENVQEGKGKHNALRNTSSLLVPVIRAGRIISDATGLSLASPMRYVMMVGKFVSRQGDITKEARLKNEEVKEKTRIQDEAEAELEARYIYETAEKMSGSDKPTAEALKTAYLMNMPEDLKKRFQEKTDKPLNIIQKVMTWEMSKWVDHLNKDLEKIEGNSEMTDAEKEENKLILIRRHERSLRDYDRMLTQAGTVDAYAAMGRYIKAIGTGAVYAATAETIAIPLEHFLDHLFKAATRSEFIPEAPYAISPIKAVHDSLPTYPNEGPIPSEIHGLEGGHIPTTEHPPVVDGSIEHIQSIEEGESVVKVAEDMIRQGQISQKDFDAAWHNPDSVALIHGEPVHISHAALVHEGNSVKFIPGTNGQAPRFEVIEGGGPALGTDQDLYNRYQELGKEAPQWLKDAIHGHIEAPAEQPDLSNLHEASEHADANLSEENEIIQTNPEDVPDYVGHYSKMGDINAELSKPEYNTDYEAHLANPIIYESGADDVIRSLSPEEISEAHSLVEDVSYKFNDLTLLEQEKVMADLGDVHHNFDKILESGQEFNGQSEMIETRDILEQMQNTLAETEQAFRDKLYSFGFKKPGEYEKLFAKKPISVRALNKMAEDSNDPRLEKLAQFVNKLKPNNKEKLLDVTSFLKSRFR